jgi:hypothetical protein
MSINSVVKYESMTLQGCDSQQNIFHAETIIKKKRKKRTGVSQHHFSNFFFF